MKYSVLLIKEILNYVKNPVPYIKSKEKLGEKIKFILVSSLIVLILKVLFALISILLRHYGIIDAANNIKEMTVDENILWMVILGPLLEEMSFRLYLNWKIPFLIISSTLIGLGFFSKEYLHTGILSPDNWTNKILFIVVNVFLFSILCISFKIEIEKFGLKYFKYIFYFSILLFGFMHIQNYTVNVNPKTILLTPFLIMPQLLGGLNSAYIRIKYGILWSYFAHALLNSVAVMLIYFKI